MTRQHITYYLLVIALLICSDTAMAQDDVEYRMDIGAGVGITSYQGDFSHNLFNKPSVGGSLIYRIILNPHMAIKTSAMVSQVKGDYSGANTIYPDASVKNVPETSLHGFSFANTIGDLCVTYEYNFWPYGTGRDYRGAKRCTPFISLGIGGTYVHTKNGQADYGTMTYSDKKSAITANIPLGCGVKYRMGDRCNISLEWQMHFTLSDYLDGVKDPYIVQSSGIFKNTDCYSTLTLGFTYSFSAKCSTCHKD